MAMIRFVLQPNKMVVFNDMCSRWVIPFAANHTSKTNLICDRANEDHCGTCGNGLLTNNPDVNYENADDYDMPDTPERRPGIMS